jgi:hypothetical protein
MVIDRARRQGQLREKRQPSRVRVCPNETHQLERRIAQRILDQKRLRAAHEKCSVDFARLERLQRVVTSQRDELGIGPEPVGGGKRTRECFRAASGNSHGDALAGQLSELVESGVAAIKHPERLIVEAGEHHHVARRRRRDAALHERDIDTGPRIEQQPQVFGGPVRHALHHRHPFAR